MLSNSGGGFVLPQSLTPVQKEYLEFLRGYIEKNECAPMLDEIAKYFGVTRPTANKTLNKLQEKGILYFDRDKVSGFYIRIPENNTSSGTLREIPVIGNVNKLGEILEFPKYHGHFPFALPKGTGETFALDIYQHMPSAGILGRDYMIFSNGGIAKPGDICIFPVGKKYFLVRMYEFSTHEDMQFHELAIQWMDMKDQYEDYLFWWPLIENEESLQNLADEVVEEKFPWEPIEPDMIIGKALRLVRRLAI